MKLDLLCESLDTLDYILDNMYQYLQKLGLTNGTVDKIFQFARSGRFHGRPAGGGKELEQLKRGRRLVAWLDKPVEGFQSMPGTRNVGYYVFRPENEDVAWLLRTVDERWNVGNVASDILNGLSFGYPPDSVYNWSRDALLGEEATRYLEEHGLPGARDRSIHVISPDVINVNHDVTERDEWLDKLSQVGEIVGGNEYNTHVKIPNKILSDL